METNRMKTLTQNCMNLTKFKPSRKEKKLGSRKIHRCVQTFTQNCMNVTKLKPKRMKTSTQKCMNLTKLKPSRKEIAREWKDSQRKM
jgi:hypothetical protein